MQGAKAKDKYLLHDFKQFVGVRLNVRDNSKILCRVCHKKITRIQVLVKDLQCSRVFGQQISRKTMQVEQSPLYSCSPSIVPPKKRPHVIRNKSPTTRNLFLSADEQGSVNEHLNYSKT